MSRAVGERFKVQGECVWVVQRLCKPTPTVNPFTFGGGGSGIDPEVLAQITSTLFSFDYMGAAEYEFGAPRKALYELTENRKSYEKFDMDLPLSAVSVDSWMGKREDYSASRKGSVKVYLICKPGQLEDVKAFIKTDARGKASLKEPTRFSSAVRTKGSDLIGWMDLRNVFLYFIDRDARDKTYEEVIGD